MGFLDHSTNNLILDAVLTDVGRQFLSRNDGSFSIVKFALGDDEVDYNIIKQFGRTVGKEKVEKNTPIFEALTNQAYAQKHKLISISNPSLIRLPTISLVSTTGDIISMGRTSTNRVSATLEQQLQNETVIDVELRDQVFLVQLNNQFLQIAGNSPDNIDAQNRATYILTRNGGEAGVTAIGGSKLTMTLELRSITDAQFTVFGTTSNKSLIRTFVRVTGLQSGAVKEFEVQVSKTG